MDGAVARACNTCTKLGAHLDIWSDIVAAAIFFTAIIYYLYSLNRTIDVGVLVIGGGLVLFNMIMAAIKEYHDTRAEVPYTNGLDKFLNNNTMALMLFGATFLSGAI